jgi:hypothetical protein
MKKHFIVIIAVVLSVKAISQSQAGMRIDTSRESVLYWSKWANNLYDMGVEKRNDSFFVKEEVIKLMKDDAYRQSVYPSAYDWQAAVQLMQQMELKKAFWHLINLYQADTAHRDLVLGTFILYDSVMEMDKVVLSTFYTYAFADPRVCRITNGKPEIYRPDILERGLYAAKEITGNIWAYRKQKAADKNK